MREKFEELLSRKAEGRLTRAQRREFQILTRHSANFRRLAARDRLIGRLLRGHYKPAVDIDQVMEALAQKQSTLSERTMAALETSDLTRRKGSSDVSLQTLTSTLKQWFPFSKPQLATFCAVSVALYALILWWAVGARTLEPEIGRVVSIVGKPTLHVAGEIPTELKDSALISFGSRIETGQADKAEFRFADGTTIQLGYNTAIEIPQPVNKRAAYSRPPEIKLLRGQVWTKVQKVTNALPYAIHTESATAIVRGTEFGVKLRWADGTNPRTDGDEATRETVLIVKAGIVDFSNKFGSVRAIALQESVARRGTAPTEPTRVRFVQQITTPVAEELTVRNPDAWINAAARLAGMDQFAGLYHSGGPGERLRCGDELLAVNGRSVTNAIGFCAQILLPANGPRSVTVRRAGQEIIVPLETISRTNQFAMAFAPDGVVKLAELMEKWTQENGSPTGNRVVLDERAEKLRVENVSSVRISPDLRAAAFNNLGILFELEGNPGAAIRAYRRAVDLDPVIPLYHLNLGRSLRSIGSLESALEEHEIVDTLTRGASAIQIDLAETEFHLSNFSNALSRIDNVVKHFPQNHRAWELRARLLVLLNRQAEALDAARKGVALEPACAVAHEALGVALNANGKRKEAEQEFRRGLQLSPECASIHFNLGALQESGGEVQLAEESYRKSLGLHPCVPVLRSLSRLLVQRQKWAAAEAILSQAELLVPDNLELAADGQEIREARQQSR